MTYEIYEMHWEVKWLTDPTIQEITATFNFLYSCLRTYACNPEKEEWEATVLKTSVFINVELDLLA